jgi:GH25 family lysozyme M1 (1,4-beta-N-acetylmuramidase)
MAISLTASPALAAALVSSGGVPERGIDISAYQNANGPIDWRELASHGVRFVAIKASEATYYTNPYYRSDARAASRAGLAVLAYAFANPDRAGGPATASFAVRAAHYRRGRGALPLVVDLENDPYSTNDCYRFGQGRMIAWIAGFTSRARALTGSWPITYTTARHSARPRSHRQKRRSKPQPKHKKPVPERKHKPNRKKPGKRIKKGGDLPVAIHHFYPHYHQGR